MLPRVLPRPQWVYSREYTAVRDHMRVQVRAGTCVVIACTRMPVRLRKKRRRALMFHGRPHPHPAHLGLVNRLLQRDELSRQPPAGPRALAHTEFACLLAPRLEPLDLIIRRDRAAAAGGGGSEVVAELCGRAAVLLDDADTRRVGAVVFLFAARGRDGSGGFIRPWEPLDLDRGVTISVRLVFSFLGLD